VEHITAARESRDNYSTQSVGRMGKQKGGREVDRRTPGSDFQNFFVTA